MERGFVSWARSGVRVGKRGSGSSLLQDLLAAFRCLMLIALPSQNSDRPEPYQNPRKNLTSSETRKKAQTKPNQTKNRKRKATAKEARRRAKKPLTENEESNHAHSKTVIRSNPFNPVLQQGGLTRRGLFLRVPSIFTRPNFVELQSGSGVGSWELAVGSRKSKVGRWDLGVEVGAKTACDGVVIRSRGMRWGRQGSR